MGGEHGGIEEDCSFRSLQKRDAPFSIERLSLKQMIYSVLKGMKGKVLIRITFSPRAATTLDWKNK